MYSSEYSFLSASTDSKGDSTSGMDDLLRSSQESLVNEESITSMEIDFKDEQKVVLGICVFDLPL